MKLKTEVGLMKSLGKKVKEERSETLLWKWNFYSRVHCSPLFIVLYAMCYISPQSYEIKAIIKDSSLHVKTDDGDRRMKD